MLKIYNTLTRKKEEFKPQNDRIVKIYTCGVTVYDDCHIGHARSLYNFEVIRRYLEFKGYRVEFVRNITDIDDKIINRSKKLQVNWCKLAEKYIAGYNHDLESLGIRKGITDKEGEEPRATKNIPDIIRHIKGLIDKDYAYQVNGNVYFRVRSFKEYGKLSGQSIESMLNSVRIEPNPDKKDPLDFALWKKSGEDEPYWDSPWGKGRPGWHIECSVMSLKYLRTQTLDIHAGGQDLVFPHHENEIAQSECLTGKPFANYWIHNGLLTINAQKMSKSLNNFVTIKDAVKKYSPLALKMFYLSAHYKSSLDFNQEKLTEISTIKKRITQFWSRLKKYNIVAEGEDKFTTGKIHEIYQKFIEYMDDDFNFPAGFSVIFDLIAEVNKKWESGYKDDVFFNQAKTLLAGILDVFGIYSHIEKTAEKPDTGLTDKEIGQKIALRNEMRAKKNFQEADKIRDELKKEGIILEDMPGGQTRWVFKETGNNENK